MSNNTYAGLIWTNHVLQRLNDRGMTQEQVSQTFYSPDQKIPGKQHSSIEYQKRFGNVRISVIAKQNEQDEWIILSCWREPPLAWTKDAKKKANYHKYQRAGFWGKFWMVVKKQLGITDF